MAHGTTGCCRLGTNSPCPTEVASAATLVAKLCPPIRALAPIP
jgi:hypothetical protein